jgi:hypothetical protein
VRQPRQAASIAAMSIFLICIMASKARFAAARSGSWIAAVRTRGGICHESPHFVLAPPACAFLAAAPHDRVPQAIRFGLIVGRDLE